MEIVLLVAAVLALSVCGVVRGKRWHQNVSLLTSHSPLVVSF